MKELAKKLGSYYPSSAEIDLELLPASLRCTLQEYLIPKNTDTPVSLLLLNLLAKCAQLVSLHRTSIKFESEKQDILINLYALIFASSGIGKNRSIRHIDQGLFGIFHKEFDEKRINYILTENTKTQEEAKDLFRNNKSKQNAYIKEYKPRDLASVLSDGTVEGFTALREAFHIAGFGATFLEISEFADYIATDNKSRADLLTALTESFDHGDLGVKITKGDKAAAAIKGIPSNALLYTSPSDLLVGNTNKKLMTFLSRGMARRSFLCYPTEDEMPKIDISDIVNMIEEERQQKEIAEQNTDLVSSTFTKAFHATEKHKVLLVTKEAELLYLMYDKHNKIRCLQKSIAVEDGIKAEFTGRSWKMLKLAGIIACIEHPENLVVTDEDIKQAIYITEIYGMHFQRFYNADVVTDRDKLFAYFVKNNNKWLSRSELARKRFVDHRQFPKWFDSNYELLKETAEDNGYFLVDRKFGSTGKQYKLLKVNFDSPESINVVLSTSIDKATRFKPETIDFLELRKIVSTDCNYSTGIFKDQHRKIENCIQQSNLIIFDVDEEMSISEAQERLKNINYAIATTRNHQQGKNGVTCDRFRIFMPVHTNLPCNNERYKNILKNIANHYGLTVDESCIEISRFYFGNPDAQYFYSNCDTLLNWEIFDFEPRASKKQAEKLTKGTPSGYSLKDVLGTEEALRRYEFYDPIRGCYEGNIDNFLKRIELWLNDEGISQDLIIQEMNWLCCIPPLKGENTHTQSDIKRITRT